ncbi:MAG: hypothetical protein QNJ97_25570 [Myxococcota bacterium]|nr:hypothetical protein [Myxococcota bacterium]
MANRKKSNKATDLHLKPGANIDFDNKCVYNKNITRVKINNSNVIRMATYLEVFTPVQLELWRFMVDRVTRLKFKGSFCRPHTSEEFLREIGCGMPPVLLANAIGGKYLENTHKSLRSRNIKQKQPPLLLAL